MEIREELVVVCAGLLEILILIDNVADILRLLSEIMLNPK